MQMKAMSAVEKESEPRRGPRYYDIINSSIEVFSRTNYEKATTALIAKEAGVAEGTLYKYFPNKKELFFACFRYIGELLMERYVKIYQETRHDPRDYILSVARSFQEFLMENPSMRLFLAFVLNNSFDQEFRDELERFVNFHVNAAEAMIRRAVEHGQVKADINPRLAAWIFVGGYYTLILMAELGAEEFAEPGFMNEIMGFFLK
jgi:TetR/AcrR family fatty acid metabolism transcriptional regulator